MAACMKSMIEETRGLGRNNIKVFTKDCFLFCSWFASKRLAEDAMYVSAEIIGMVKTNKYCYVMIPSTI